MASLSMLSPKIKLYKFLSAFISLNMPKTETFSKINNLIPTLKLPGSVEEMRLPKAKLSVNVN